MSGTDFVLYTLENFLPWHRHLPKKILLNFVAAKASRHISCPFCPFTYTSLYHFLYCSIYYLQLNLKICDSLFQITNFVIVAFWTVVLAFGFLREISADEFYLTPLLGLDYFALLLLPIVLFVLLQRLKFLFLSGPFWRSLLGGFWQTWACPALPCCVHYSTVNICADWLGLYTCTCFTDIIG